MARPSLCRAVVYTRAVGEEYAATVTHVLPATGPSGEGAKDDEKTYDVWLAVDLVSHDTNNAIGRRWYTPSPIRFDGRDMPAANTWRWPPKV